MNFAWWIRGAEYAEMAKISIASVRRVYGKAAQCWIVTDEDSPAWIDSMPAQVLQLKQRYPQSMVANVDCQYELMSHICNPAEWVTFLDADVVLAKELEFPPCETIPDIFVTWRNHVNGSEEMAREQPYNYGVFGVRMSRQTMEMMVWLRYRILQMAPQHQQWYGNQLALADLLGQPRGERFTATMRWTLNDPGTKLEVLSLPCDQWNYSPDSIDEDVSSRSVLHFKGNRKEWMERYA